MTGRLKHLLEGFPFQWTYMLGGMLKAGSNVTLTDPNGPGQINCIHINQISGLYSNFMDAKVTITIDGVVQYDGYIYWLLMVYGGYAAHGLLGTADLAGTFFCIMTLSVPMEFLSTFQITFYTVNVTGNNMICNLDSWEAT